MDARDEQFIERMGQLYQNDAMPRIAGRMFGLLLLSPEPRSMDEIAELLQVSKASVSANARLLETIHMIERVTRPGDRRDYYEVTEDTYQRMIELRLQRIRRMKALLDDGMSTSAGQTEPVRSRLAGFCRSFEVLIDTVTEVSASRRGATQVTGARVQEEA